MNQQIYRTDHPTAVMAWITTVNEA